MLPSSFPRDLRARTPHAKVRSLSVSLCLSLSLSLCPCRPLSVASAAAAGRDRVTLLRVPPGFGADRDALVRMASQAGRATEERLLPFRTEMPRKLLESARGVVACRVGRARDEWSRLPCARVSPAKLGARKLGRSPALSSACCSCLRGLASLSLSLSLDR